MGNHGKKVLYATVLQLGIWSHTDSELLLANVGMDRIEKKVTFRVKFKSGRASACVVYGILEFSYDRNTYLSFFSLKHFVKCLDRCRKEIQQYFCPQFVGGSYLFSKQGKMRNILSGEVFTFVIRCLRKR